MFHMLILDMRFLEVEKVHNLTLMSTLEILNSIVVIIESNANKAQDAI